MFHEFVGLIRIYKVRVISLPCLNSVFNDHRSTTNGDKTYLIFHVASYDQLFKGLCDLMGGSLLQ